MYAYSNTICFHMLWFVRAYMTASCLKKKTLRTTPHILRTATLRRVACGVILRDDAFLYFLDLKGVE